MEKTGINEKDLEILTEINKHKYWRRVRTIKLCIAIGLILSICYFSYINYHYANDIRQYRASYGPQWSCYLCGYENLRSCNCITTYNKNINESFKEDLGNNNINACGFVPRQNELLIPNFSISN